jgi:hypothetical protein
MDALASYVTFLDADGAETGLSIHNFPHADPLRFYEGRTYLHAGFGYTGAEVSLDAANSEAALVFVVTDLMLATAEKAAKERWLAEVWTVWLDPDTLAETTDRLEELYVVTSWKQNLRELVMTLGSPLDARDAEIPARVLTRKLVGNLPPSGAISFL